MRENLGEEAADRLSIHVLEGDEALSFVEGLPDASFDVALIDCTNEFTWRRPCLLAARPKLRSGGWMVLDNSDHPNNWAAVEAMEDRERTSFSGWAPMCSVVTQTTFWEM